MSRLIRNAIAAPVVLLALTGCVNDADYGQIERSGSGLFVEKLTVIREGVYQKDYFARCVQVNAKHFDVPREKGKPASGIIRHDNDRTLQITGNTLWRFAFVDRYMLFKLTAQHYGRRFYTFERIRSGERRGAIWPVAARGIEGRRGLQALVDVADKIEQCQRDLNEP